MYYGLIKFATVLQDAMMGLGLLNIIESNVMFQFKWSNKIKLTSGKIEHLFIESFTLNKKQGFQILNIINFLYKK